MPLSLNTWRKVVMGTEPNVTVSNIRPCLVESLVTVYM